ncbi:threonine/serine exporter family protein [Sediminitomix flava]|uniref:Uncharacterized membrane protein YjjP (DUF1212 family) n=1 Tax=Sediminitomix flava TaxID=379075 RepID=A0A315Z705_SEDFL|nr:threonine/serine exporter family protein [Sediminitomix flava]PWJ39185.1 uncharacterized membrane protein YjjP (DUF1212 family) [Sediminitomix flava]
MNIPEEYRFIVQLGRALHKYGVPSYRIQEYLKEVSATQNIQGDFMDLPTWVNYVFYDSEDQHTYNYIRNVQPGEYNLSALGETVDITNQFLSGELKVSEARQALKDLEQKPMLHRKMVQAFAYGVTASAFSILMEANYITIITSFIIGFVIGAFAIMAQRSSYLNSALESLAAFIATILTGCIYFFFPQVNLLLTVIASIIVFVPGMAITRALEEITSKSLVSGTAKLFDALVSLFKQFFGVMLGLSIWKYIFDLPPMTAGTVPPSWLGWIAIPLFLLSLVPIFNIRKKDIVGCVIIGFISYGLMLSLDELGPMVSTFIASVSVILISKLIKKITASPEIIFSTLGILMLVPGSKAFLGLSSAFQINETVDNASQIGLQVAYILMGVIGGLIFSGVFKQTKG